MRENNNAAPSVAADESGCGKRIPYSGFELIHFYCNMDFEKRQAERSMRVINVLSDLREKQLHRIPLSVLSVITLIPEKELYQICQEAGVLSEVIT